MPDYKLGKKAAIYDPNTLRLEKYLVPPGLGLMALPSIPASADWGSKIDHWILGENDKIGDCGIVGPANQILAWSTYAQPSPSRINDSEIVSAYSDVSGYNPTTGEHDEGVVLLDVLKYWKSHGIAGHHILAYLAVRPGDHFSFQAGLYLFGSMNCGLQLPLSAQAQIGGLWDVPIHSWGPYYRPGSWGGHDVAVIAFDAVGLTCVTWQKPQRMTWQFWAACCDEAYAILSRDWLNSGNVSPGHFDIVTLQQDLKDLNSV